MKKIICKNVLFASGNGTGVPTILCETEEDVYLRYGELSSSEKAVVEKYVNGNHNYSIGVVDSISESGERFIHVHKFKDDYELVD